MRLIPWLVLLLSVGWSGQDIPTMSEKLREWREGKGLDARPQVEQNGQGGSSEGLSKWRQARGSAVDGGSCTQAGPGTCFADPGSRKGTTAGEWVLAQRPPGDASSRRPHYYNLSCPFEWSKYSCVRHGTLSTAERASRIAFVPFECAMLDFDGAALAERLRGGRRLLFVGDSLIRQVVISLACMAHSHGVVESSDVPWPECGEGDWPCHSTPKCVPCGQHSGAAWISATLVGGGTIRFTTIENLLASSSWRDAHFVFCQSGMHGHVRDTVRTMADKIQGLWDEADEAGRRSSARVVWMTTPPQHFQGEPSGTYTEESSSATSAAGGVCSHKVSTDRRDTELAVLMDRPAGLVERLHAVLDLGGMEGLGEFKVQHVDCKHFCMPGVPDEVARAVYTMVMAAGDSEAST